MRHRLQNEIDTQAETLFRRSEGVARLIDPFPEIADVVVAANDDGKITFIIIDTIKNRPSPDLVWRFDIQTVDVVVRVKDHVIIGNFKERPIRKDTIDVLFHDGELP